jgi:hypothetical protein
MPVIALMMEVARTSETSVNFYQTTQRNNPDGSHLHFILDNFCFSRRFNDDVDPVFE